MRDERPPLTFADIASQPPVLPPPELAAKLFSSYRPWRKVRYVAADLDIRPLDAWRMTKCVRQSTWRPLRIPRYEGGSFGMCATPLLAEPLLLIDRSTGLSPSISPSVATGGQLRSLQKRLLSLQRDGQLLARQAINTTMGEAAESSIMEGAATTLRDALDMLRSGRAPKSPGERMVLNNYFAMQQIKQWIERPLSVEMLLELQEMLTEATVDDSDGVGRLRTDRDSVRIVDSRTSETIFTPPPESFLGGLLRATCEFANHDHSGAEFIHPVVKAAILHFLIGYAHPFVDGNGRTARAVFYWFALRHGYGVFEFLSISEIIRKGYAKYPQAYIDSELDDGDLTYFVLYQLDAVQQALERLAQHIEHEHDRIKRSEPLLKLAKDLNLRQRLILEHALRHPLTQYTVNSHMNSNGIVAATARADLDDLVQRRLMVTSKKGKQVLYLIAPTVESRLNRREAK